MRASLAALALIALAAGCGSPTGPSKQGAPEPGSLQTLWRQSGQSVSLIPGASDFSPGHLRISFLVVDPHGRVVAPPRARFWIARSLRARPFQETVARLEPVGVPDRSADRDIGALYVAHVHVASPGSYYVLARPIGAVRIGGIHDVLVKSKSASPAVGSRAYPSRTPTLARTGGGQVTRLTTRVPPDLGLLRYSVAGSVAAHKRFVVTFATPRYCESRICGPVVDVVDAARRRFAASGIRFIHVEIYAGNDPRNGPNRWVHEWHLPGEPWTFLVGRDGKIKAKFEGSFSSRELDDAIHRVLR